MSDPSPWRTLFRVEPGARAVDPVPGAEAPLGDPLWLLGRQWWMGEMGCFDGGTPLTGTITRSAEPLVADRLPGVPSDDLLPSELLAEPVRIEEASLHWRDRLRLSQSLLAHVEPSGLAEELATMLAALAPLEASHPALRRMPAERRIDGARVVQMARAGALSLSGELERWVNDWLRLTPLDEPEAGLDHDTRQHSAALTGAAGSRLGTTTARGPRLHWSDLDGPVASADTESAARPLTRVSLPGAQPNRWWRFEDDTLDWTAAPAGPSDLGQLLIAASFAEQGQLLWQCTLEAPTNALVEIRDMAYTDTFGIRRDLKDARHDALRGWCLPGGAFPVLATAPLLQGAALEQASLRADPTDNLVWLEETVHRDEEGRGIAWRPAPRFEDPEVPSVVLRAAPPINWRAYGVAGDDLVFLQMPDQPVEGATGFAKARFGLRPSQLGTRGLSYRLLPMLGRTATGRRVCWQVAVARSAERAAGSSGLRHDTIARPAL